MKKADENQPRIQVIAQMVGICHMRVCAVADASDAEVLAVANSENPSGTSQGWATVIREGTKKAGGPVMCADDTTRVHLMLEC